MAWERKIDLRKIRLGEGVQPLSGPGPNPNPMKRLLPDTVERTRATDVSAQASQADGIGGQNHLDERDAS